MRRHTQHPYYIRYGGGHEVPGPALPPDALQSPVGAGMMGDSARGSGDGQSQALGAQHANPRAPADSGTISAAQLRQYETGNDGRDAGAGQANQQPLEVLQPSSNTDCTEGGRFVTEAHIG